MIVAPKLHPLADPVRRSKSSYPIGLLSPVLLLKRQIVFSSSRTVMIDIHVFTLSIYTHLPEWETDDARLSLVSKMMLLVSQPVFTKSWR